MSETLATPTINVEEIQQRANEAAQKAYLNEVEQYYTAYNSPYRKKIKEELENQKFDWNLQLPDVLGKINEALIKEVDTIANNAIATSYLPIVSDTLIKMGKEIEMSEVLKTIVEDLDGEYDDRDDFYFNYNKHEKYDWLSCELTTPKDYYEFTLHTHKKDDGTIQYQLLSFPHNKYKTGYNSNMTIYKDDVKIELPFTPNILSDKVLRLFFRLMLGNTKINMDCSGFDDDMFPENHCHC